MLGEIRAMQVYTMTRKNSKKYLHSTISYKYKIVLWKFFYAGSQIRAVQIRAIRNRASRGMTVLEFVLLQGICVNQIFSQKYCIALFFISIKSCYENFFMQAHKFVLCKFVP